MEGLGDIGQYGDVAGSLFEIGLQYGLSLVTAVLILVAGFIVAGWASRSVRRYLERVDDVDATLIPVLGQIARYAVLVITLLLVLAEFGVQTASLIAVLGAAGLAIGLALQGTLQNVAAGMMLLFLRPFRTGEYIAASSVSGTVDEIGLFMTKLMTPQGVLVLAPNSTLWSDSITNYSRMPTRRLDLAVGISYDDDIDTARGLVLDLAKRDSRVIEDPEPICIVTGMGESSVDLELRAWIKRDDFWDVNFEMTRAVKYALDKAGITIPYPHRQIVMTPAEADKSPAKSGSRPGSAKATDPGSQPDPEG